MSWVHSRYPQGATIDGSEHTTKRTAPAGLATGSRLP